MSWWERTVSDACASLGRPALVAVVGNLALYECAKRKAEAHLGEGDESARGNVVGHVRESGEEERVPTAVISFLQLNAAQRDIVVAEARAVVRRAERVEGEVDKADFGVAEPAGEGERNQHDDDAAPEDVVPHTVGRDDADPEPAAIERVGGIERLQDVFAEIGHEKRKIDGRIAGCSQCPERRPRSPFFARASAVIDRCYRAAAAKGDEKRRDAKGGGDARGLGNRGG